MLSEDQEACKKMHTLSSDDGRRYDFDFHALSKVKRRAKCKVLILMLMIFLLALGLVAMVILYHMKPDSEIHVIYKNGTEPTELDVKTAKVVAYRRIAKYGEDCSSTSKHRIECGANAYCRYLQGTHRCDCKQGFIGDGIGDCKDVHFSIDFRKPTTKNVPELRRIIFPETNAVSVCFWYKLADVRQKWLSALMYTSVEIPGSNDFMIWFTRDQIHATMRSSGQPIFREPLPINVWTHFCWVWESSGQWVTYLSGKKVNAGYVASKKAFQGDFQETHGNFLLGQDKDDDSINEPKQMFRGEITQLYLYHKKLTNQEVFAAYNKRPPTDNIIIGWWKFKNQSKNGTDIAETRYPFDS